VSRHSSDESAHEAAGTRRIRPGAEPFPGPDAAPAPGQPDYAGPHRSGPLPRNPPGRQFRGSAGPAGQQPAEPPRHHSGATQRYPTTGTPRNPAGAPATNHTAGTPRQPTAGTPRQPTAGTPGYPSTGAVRHHTAGTPRNPAGGAGGYPAGSQPTGGTGLPHRSTAGVPQRRVGAGRRVAAEPPRLADPRTRRGRPGPEAAEPAGDGVDERLAALDTVVFGTRARRAGGLGTALLVTLSAAILPGLGHLLLRRRTGWAILGAFALAMLGAAAFVTRVPREHLVEYVLKPDLLIAGIFGCLAASVLWLAVILRTYDLAKPAGLGTGKQAAGGVLVFMLCLAVCAPFAFAGYTANAQRNLVNALFPSGSGNGKKAPAGDAAAIKKPRINILLLGSDAGQGRIGARTDTMIIASIDTKSAQTVLFSLPRNTSYAQFPPGSKMAQQFPRGFHDPKEPTSGNYLLNAVYAYAHEFPALAPPGPSNDPGLNLLSSSISHMLGLSLDYYIVVNMQGFAAIVDALGGLDVNVGPAAVPMGGIGPFGEVVKPFGWIQAGQQHLDGLQSLWYARSRTNSSDYVRMGRQRCLMQYLIDQKSPIDVLKNFQEVSQATTDSVSTNIPQEVLPALMTLAGKAKNHPLESIAFDPSLPDPDQPDGRYNTGDPNFPLIRQVVRSTIASQSPSAAPSSAAAAPTTVAPPTTTRSATGTKPKLPASSQATATTAQPTSLNEACGPSPTG
jgi:LCP family protein required for cell wall assembly